MNKPTQLISDTYCELNKKLHDTNTSYGANGHRWAQIIQHLVHENKLNDVLDYGCGKQTLKKALPNIKVHGYDPAFPELADSPSPSDLVFCGDVLEHVEPEYTEAVLDDLQRVTQKLGFFVISIRPAKKILADGRNAHINLKTSSDWAILLAKRFNLLLLLGHIPALNKSTPSQRILAKFGLLEMGLHALAPEQGEVIFLVEPKGK